MNIKIINKQANHADSMRILKENKLEPLTYQEALANGKELVKLAKGRWMWFWLAGKGLDKSGYHTIDKYGDVRAGKGEVENTVYLWSGTSPLSLFVRSVDGAARGGGRFVLYANVGPDGVAPVVVGKRNFKFHQSYRENRKGALDWMLEKHKHRFVCECGKALRKKVEG